MPRYAICGAERIPASHSGEIDCNRSSSGARWKSCSMPSSSLRAVSGRPASAFGCSRSMVSTRCSRNSNSGLVEKKRGSAVPVHFGSAAIRPASDAVGWRASARRYSWRA